MAKISFKGDEAFGKFLSQYWKAMEDGGVLGKAVKAGAAIVADQIRANLEALPEEGFRRLRYGEIFEAVPKGQKKDLADSFGLTPLSRDRDGNLNTKVGFDGYGSDTTPKYPQGIPNQLLARTIESGSSVRAKIPFVRPAVTKTRKQAVAKMQEVLEAEMKKLEGGST